MKRKKSLRLKTAGLFCLLGILVLLCVLRFTYEDQKSEVTAAPVHTEAPAPSAAVSESPHAEPTPTPTLTPLPKESPAAPEPETQIGEEHAYTEYTWSLASDAVYTYRQLQREGWPEIEQLLAKMEAEDSRLGKLWRSIMTCWDGVNYDLQLNRDAVPEGLPQDDSLCIVILGYQLMYDGTMAPELLGRCTLGLKAAEAYPNALIAVTGGGTAPGDRSATEAGVMADWLIAQGVAAEHIIREDRSLTTVQNAKNTCEILTGQFPQVKEILMVTSDYHLPLGILLFQEAAYLYEYENGELPYSVTENAAYTAPEKADYLNISWQSSDLWSMADPQY